jgi:hypothetical protein
VREDYSAGGTAWDYFPHDHARSRAYRWGEDGIAGICDEDQTLCFALALWNGRDPILKERLFGLTGSEGNHGEDGKEYAFYLDNVPSHSYMKYLYKYPHGTFPYADLVETNRQRNRFDFEYELLDTGIFAEERYDDVTIEYAKAGPDDILIRISVANRGPDASTLQVLPTLWFRNRWSWSADAPRPEIRLGTPLAGTSVVETSHPAFASYRLFADGAPALLFTENETNNQRLFGSVNVTPFVKDGIGEYIVGGNAGAINPEHHGTKVAAQYVRSTPGGQTSVIRLRLTAGIISQPFGPEFDRIFAERQAEADAFYAQITPFAISDDMRNVQRQAFAGLLWNKQFYKYDVAQWLAGDPGQPPPPASREHGRNADWGAFRTTAIYSMPDKWEYPWFASWDLGFHTIPLALIDPDFAKNQLLLLTRAGSLDPSGALPAYEWNFDDANPPVHAMAAMRVYQIEAKMYGRKDRAFLETMMHRLMTMFEWWINRKDAGGNNIFEGGFLGLDNIGVFDRAKAAPEGGTLEEVDGTSWVSMFCLNLLTTALELADEDPSYEDLAATYFEHFVRIADAIDTIGDGDRAPHGLWNDKAGFYYDVLNMPDGRSLPIEADTMLGLMPLFASSTNDAQTLERYAAYGKRFKAFVADNPSLAESIVNADRTGAHGRMLLSLVDDAKLRRLLAKALDPAQFLSPFGIRSVSRVHLNDPVAFTVDGKTFDLNYEPAESTTGMFGGNSNWRGPVWFPLNYLLIESLQRFHYYFGDAFRVECPVGSGTEATLWEISTDLSHRLISIFLNDETGRRPLYGGIATFQTDPHWHDLIFFHEYFHGDNGAGLGASNQTGWTGLVAKLIRQYGEYAIGGKAPNMIERETL